MTVETAPALLDAVREYRLLRPEQLAELTPDVLARCPDSKSLARELLQRGWLTRFQLSWILNGCGPQLVLGGYHLLDRLGTGGMGEVYKALQRRLNRVVALKLIRPDLMRNETQVRRFQHEAQAAARLQHEHIVAVYDFDEANGSHFLAMEYVDGVDLGQIVKSNGPLPVPLACAYIRQAAIGLSHAHERGLVHRDIKPSNILVDRSGVVKVLDMGLARLSADTEDDALTKTGTVVGTPDFMAPEQAKNSRSVGPPADIYSLGATLYYLLTAQPLFPGDTAIEKLLSHQTDAPPVLQRSRADVPPGLEMLFQRLVAKRPTDRPSCCEEVVIELEPYTSAVPMTAAPMPMVAQPLMPTVAFAPVQTPSGAANSSPFGFSGTQEELPSLSDLPLRSRRRRSTLGNLVALVGLLVFLAVLGAGAFVGYRVYTGRMALPMLPTTKEEPTTPTKPATKSDQTPKPADLEPFERYLPEETGSLLVFNMARALEVEAVEKHLRVPEEVQEKFESLNFDPIKQAKRYVFVLDRGDAKKFSLIVQSDSMNSLFMEALARLSRPEEIRVTKERPLQTVYHIKNEDGTTVTLAILAPRAMIICSDPADAREALRREFTRGDKKTFAKDAFILESLPKYRNDYLVWGAMSSKQDLPANAPRPTPVEGGGGVFGFLRVGDGGKLLFESELSGGKIEDLKFRAELFKGFLSTLADTRGALIGELAKEAKVEARPAGKNPTKVVVTSELSARRWGPMLTKLFKPTGDGDKD